MVCFLQNTTVVVFWYGLNVAFGRCLKGPQNIGKVGAILIACCNFVQCLIYENTDRSDEGAVIG